MRIIGGTFGGRVIQVPKGLPARPTTDRTKEALFNILTHRLDWEDTRVLDLFSGTGNITLECWSRGAKEVVSVEKDHKSVRAIQANLQKLQIKGGKVLKMDVKKMVAQKGEPFDLIYMDPPYDMPGQPQIIQHIMDNGWLAKNGTLIVEHRKSMDFSEMDGFEEVRNYGDTGLSFFEFPEEEEI